ncbi:enoyl-CoA hydratase-related protein [Pseudonocardia xishanensis]|uniref:Enoyl-CoA hydratase n=1 Tax=Pseudonocardia xishanensis TaxID=630995 RepID=A0ABP8RYF8_9PSEU
MVEHVGLVTRIEGAAVRLELARPDVLNAVDKPLLTALTQAIDRHGADPAVRVIVIAGQGRAFCAGADIRADDQVLVEAASGLIRSITNARVPVVAAVHGLAAGLGVSLVLACDFALLARSASLTLAFTRIGLMPDGGATALLAATVGRTRAMRIALLADRIEAELAESWGLVTSVHPDDGLDAAVADVVDRLGRGPGLAYAQTKKVLNLLSIGQLEQAFEAEEAGQRVLAASADFREGVTAFAERRRAQFTGA